LSVVYNVVAGSGGHVSVQSTPAQGTAFRVCFPQVAPLPPPAPVEPVVSGPRSGTETILVAEDQPELLLMVCFYLQKLGYNVLQASDGAKAVELAAQYSGVIDLLLTDVVMPGLRGPEVAHRLTASRPGMRVIYMSGYTEGAFGAGSDEEHQRLKATLLQKPFKLDDLAASVREVLDAASSIA
ncbi:MAG: response regulator, partial [Terriglobales bacterium]